MATQALDIANAALLLLGADPIASMTEANDRARLCNQFYDDMRRETLRAHPWNFALLQTQIEAREQTSANFSGLTGTVTLVATDAVFQPDDVGSIVQDSSGGRARIKTFVDANTVTCLVEGNDLKSTALVSGTWAIVPAMGLAWRYDKPSNYLRVFKVENPGAGFNREIWFWWVDINNRPEPVKVKGQHLHSDVGPLMNIEYIQDITDVSLWDPSFVTAFSHHLAAKIAYGVTGSLNMQKMQWDAYIGKLRDARTIDGQEDSGDDIYPDDLVAVRM